MLETILTHLHNWFSDKKERRSGAFEIVSGELDVDFIKTGQYYRIKGSTFNDGLHRFPLEDLDMLTDEAFEGEIWPLRIPKAVLMLADEIDAYCKQNPQTDKISESFGGYSYQRATNGAGGVGGWETVFAPRLNAWRKAHE